MAKFETGTVSRTIEIYGQQFNVIGHGEYLNPMGANFEPKTVALLASLCDPDSCVLDVGANVGMTALAFSQICARGRVVAIEPVPQTFECLRRNLSEANVKNVTALNFGAGNTSGSFTMQGAENNAAGAFVANQHTAYASGHFSAQVAIKRIDEVFDQLGLGRLDVAKIDVEGFELAVLEGAANTIDRYRPRVLLEMNHWCLNALQRTTLPEFRERLLKVFPYVYAVEFPMILDFSDERNLHTIYYRHFNSWQFMNIVAGFEHDDLWERLQSFSRAVEALVGHTVAATPRNAEPVAESSEVRLARAERLRQEAEQRLCMMEERLAESERRANVAESTLDQVLRSKSWHITAPLRSAAKLFKAKSA